MRIAVIGDGGWGTAIAVLLAGYGHNVSIWGYDPAYIKRFSQAKENMLFLPGVRIPDGVLPTSSEAEAVSGADAVVLASPSKFFASVLNRFKGLIPDRAMVVSLTKGFDEESGKTMSSIASGILSRNDIAVLSGPSHAEEVARSLPTAVVAASRDESLSRAVQDLFTGPRFRVYTSPDPLGVEIGGAVKNVIAVAVGVSDGMGFGDNTRAALITRGLAEMTRLGTAMGAYAETFNGLSGCGDLIVTCSSRHSRNHMVGERLGRGEGIAEIVSSMKMVAEGVWNSHIVHALSQSYGVEMPISTIVHRFCDAGMSPKEALESLMNRQTKSELGLFGG